jgi:hypothetical protein
MQLPILERDGEALLQALVRERYLYRAGLKAELDLAPIYERYPEFRLEETFLELQAVALEPRLQQALLDFVAEVLLGDATSRLDDEIALRIAAAQVEFLGATLPLRAATIRRIVEPDRDRRHLVDEGIRAQIATLDRLRTERLHVMRATVERLGYRDCTELWSELRGLDLGRLAELGDASLDVSRDLYDQALRDQLVHLKLESGDVWRADLHWVLRGAEHDALFSSRGQMDRLHRVAMVLGMPLQDRPEIRFDLESRPLKDAGTFLAPLNVPGEVVVVLNPVGGWLDMAGLLYGLGRALNATSIDRTQPFARRRLGDHALGEAYGELFRSLIRDETWLRDQLEIERPRDLSRLARFETLHRLRHVSALIRYQQELYQAEEPDVLAEGYADRLSDALGVGFFRETYLDELGGGMEAPTLLRGMLLAGQLREFLRREYDAEWYRSARAGRFLIELWREGQRYTAEELARFMGFEGLDVTPLLEEIRAGLTD